MRLSHKNKIVNKRNAKQIKFHNWFNQVRLLAKQQNINNVEPFGNWSMYFSDGSIPVVALNRANIDKF
jgi:hypothetical protein